MELYGPHAFLDMHSSPCGARVYAVHEERALEGTETSVADWRGL